MKKKLESELVSIAHRILKLKGKEDVIKMHTEASVLFEKLSVLKFLYENENEALPTLGHKALSLDATIHNKISDINLPKSNVYIDLGQAEEPEDIMVPGIETIKKMVEHMPDEAEPVDAVLKEVLNTKQQPKDDFEAIMSGFKSTPIFEPVSKTQNGISNEKKSLNDKLKVGGLNIGLNDKIAFIKQLFEGNNEDYERVISQLNAFDSFEEAKQFITEIVKLDYNHWAGKEDVEARFLQIIESKYN